MNVGIQIETSTRFSHDTDQMVNNFSPSLVFFTTGIVICIYLKVTAKKVNMYRISHYQNKNTLKQELNGTKAYEETSIDEKSVVYSHSK